LPDQENLRFRLDLLFANIAELLRMRLRLDLESEWITNKSNLSEKIDVIESEADNIHKHYRDSNQPADIVQSDIQLLADLLERIGSIRADIAAALIWLNKLDEADRPQAIEELDLIRLKLQNIETTCSDLNNHLSSDILRKEEFNYQYQQIVTKLSSIENHVQTDDPTLESNAEDLLRQLDEVEEDINSLRLQMREKSNVRPSDDLDLDAKQQQLESLRSDIKHQQSLKQLEASELEIEVDKLKREIEEKIQEASLIVDDPSASIDRLQQAANILDTVQSKVLTLKQLHINQQEVNIPENAALRQRLAIIFPEIYQKWLITRRRVSMRIEELLRQLGQRLAHLVTEGQQLLVNNTVHPDKFNEHANQLRTLIRETEAIISTAAETSIGVEYDIGDSILASIDSVISSSTLETTEPSVSVSSVNIDNQLKLTQSTVENAEKVRDLLDAKWIIWAEFCKLREATYSKLEFLKKPLINMQEKALRSLDEAREDIQELTVSLIILKLIYSVLESPRRFVAR
jgi:hypothetical protein